MGILWLAVFCLSKAFSLSISPQEAAKMAEKIWYNECKGTIEGLTSWNTHENFPSLGIGHFIWYPVGKREGFQETFPDLLKFLQTEGIELPSWLKSAPGCPWKTRDEFYQQIKSKEMSQLRQLLIDTKTQQALFIAVRLEKALPRITEKLSPEEQEKITTHFNRLAADGKGLYALIDYVHFKGEGISPTETYQGQGWGLLQVLQVLPPSSKDIVSDFVLAAKKILTLRVQNAPPERNESRWLSGWCHRVESYTK